MTHLESEAARSTAQIGRAPRVPRSHRPAVAAWRVIATLAIWVGTGCAAHSPAASAPEPSHSASPRARAYSPPISVAPDRRETRIGIFPGSTVTVDYATHSDRLVAQLTAALGEGGALLTANAERRVVVRLLRVRLSLSERRPRPVDGCAVDVEARTTAGYVRDFSGRAEGSSRARACRRAIDDAVRAIVADPGIARFVHLEGRALEAESGNT